MDLRHPETHDPASPDLVVRRPRPVDAATILAIFVALQFLLPSRLVLKLPFPLSAASIVALGLGVLWMCTQLTSTLGAAKGRSPVRTTVLAYACALLAAYGSSNFGYLPDDERGNGDHAMVTAFAMIFVALAVCDGVRSRERLYVVLRVTVICGATVAAVGILQFLFDFDITPYLQPPGTHLTIDLSSVLERAGLRRVAGTTAHPIELGVLCAMMLPLATHLALASRAQHRQPVFWWICVLLLATGLMFSVSRSAVLAAACVGTLLFVGWSAHRRVWMVVASLGFLAAIKVVSPGLLGTFVSLFRNTSNDDSVRWRTHDYATAGDLISENLLLGRGVGTWYAPKHEVFDNQYLLTLVESGVVGLATSLGVVAAAFYAAWRVGRLCHRTEERMATVTTDRDLALSVAAALVAVIPAYATFDFATFATVTSLFFLLVGIAGAHLRIVSDDVAGTPPDPYAVV